MFRFCPVMSTANRNHQTEAPRTGGTSPPGKGYPIGSMQTGKREGDRQGASSGMPDNALGTTLRVLPTAILHAPVNNAGCGSMADSLRGDTSCGSADMPCDGPPLLSDPASGPIFPLLFNFCTRRLTNPWLLTSESRPTGAPTVKNCKGIPKIEERDTANQQVLREISEVSSRFVVRRSLTL